MRDLSFELILVGLRGLYGEKPFYRALRSLGYKTIADVDWKDMEGVARQVREMLGEKA